MKLRINAGDKDATNAQDDAITEACRKRFIIPLDFDMLDSVMPFYQAGFGNRLCYEITFNDYGKVINALRETPSSDASYKISNISLEYEIVTQPDVASRIATEYQSIVLWYDRILRHSTKPVNKTNTMWNWSFNTPCQSLKGIMVKKSRTYEIRVSFTIQRHRKFLSLWKVNPISYTLRECDHLSNRMKSVSTALKESRGTPSPMRLKNN